MRNLFWKTLWRVLVPRLYLTITPQEQAAADFLAAKHPPSEEAVKGFDKMLEQSTQDNKVEQEKVEGEQREQRGEQQQEEKKESPKQESPKQEQEQQEEPKQEEQKQQEEQQQQEEVKEEVAPVVDSSKVLAEKFDKLIEAITPKPQPKEQPKAPEFKLFEVDDGLMEQVLEGGEVGKKALTKAIQVAAVQGAQMAIQVVSGALGPLQAAHQQQAVQAAENEYLTTYPEHKSKLELGRLIAYKLLQSDPGWQQRSRKEFFSAVHDGVNMVIALAKEQDVDGQQQQVTQQQPTRVPKTGGGGARGASGGGGNGGAELSAEQEMMKDLQGFQPRQGRS